MASLEFQDTVGQAVVIMIGSNVIGVFIRRVGQWAVCFNYGMDFQHVQRGES